jgi:hypothetical protein
MGLEPEELGRVGRNRRFVRKKKKRADCCVEGMATITKGSVALHTTAVVVEHEQHSSSAVARSLKFVCRHAGAVAIVELQKKNSPFCSDNLFLLFSTPPPLPFAERQNQAHTHPLPEILLKHQRLHR